VCNPHTFYHSPFLTPLHPCPPSQGNKHGHTLASAIVRTEREQHKLFTQLVERYRDRQGGYTRVVPLGRRQHDAAPMAIIE
jgi:large subunit ribosomal protein L17